VERLNSLPSYPLKRRDIVRLRAQESVDGFIELESRAQVLRNGGLGRAVVLIEGTVIALSFEEEDWKQTVLARDADGHQHITETLDYIGSD
jgi:hypothetical protein